MPKAESGALSPVEAAEDTLKTGLEHLSETLQLTFLKSVYGAILLSAGGLLALILSTGCPGIKESNPGMARLLQGFTFPIGLIMVYFVGAELYTGYPMWYTLTTLERKGKPAQYVSGLLFCWTGNLVGALFFSGIMTYFTKALAEEPWRSGVVELVTEDIVEKEWHVIFLRAVGCGFLNVLGEFDLKLVTLLGSYHRNTDNNDAVEQSHNFKALENRHVTQAMFFGTQNHDGISKALGLFLPFLISTTAKFLHTVEYMYLGLTGMMLGAPLSVGGFLYKCMLPITLGNTIGGALFTGLYSWWVLLRCGDGEKTGSGSTNYSRVNGTDYED